MAFFDPTPAAIINQATPAPISGLDVAKGNAEIANKEAQTQSFNIQNQTNQFALSQAQGKAQAAKDAFELDADGHPVIDPSTGVAKISIPKYQNNLFKAGLGMEAIKTEAEIITNQKGKLENTDKILDVTTQVRNFLANAAHATHESTPGSEDDKEAASKTMWNNLRDMVTKAPPQPGVAPLDPKQLEYLPGSTKTLYTAQIAPLNAETLKVAQGNLDIAYKNLQLSVDTFENSKKTSFTDKDSLDPNSLVSKTARSVIKNALGIDVPENVDAGTLYRNTLYTSALNSVGGAVGAARNAAAAERNKWMSLDKTIDDAKDVLGKNKWTPAQFVQNWVEGKIQNTPETQALYAQLATVPPNIVNSAQSFEALKATTGAMIDGATRNYNSFSGGPGTPAAPNNTVQVQKRDQYKRDVEAAEIKKKEFEEQKDPALKAAIGRELDVLQRKLNAEKPKDIPTQTPTAPAAPQNTRPIIKSQAEYDKLPKGAKYQDENGVPHTKGQ